MVLGIQIVGALFGLIMLYITFLNLKRKEYDVKEFVLWLGVWVFFLFFTIFPKVLDKITKPLSISRKLDLLIIAGMLFVIGLSYYNYSITRKTERRMEQVVRAVAIKKAKKK